MYLQEYEMDERKSELVRHLAELIKKSDESGDGLQLPGWELSDWHDLMAGAEDIKLGDGEILLRRGETSSDLYFLVRGNLEVSVPRADSISISPVIAIGPGSVVGEMAFFDKRGRSASVWSQGASELLRLRRDGFETFKKDHPALACDLLYGIGRILATRLRRQNGNHERSTSTYAL